MAYTKQTWDTTSYVNPTRMNHIENGIANAMTSGDMGYLGAKNLNSTPYFHGTSREDNGVTFTVNADGSVSTSGTATGANAQFQCHNRFTGSNTDLVLPNGDYILSGCPSGGSTTKYYLQALSTKNNEANVYGYDVGSGKAITLNGDDYSDNEVTLGIYITIRSGQNANGLVFRPMIRLAGDNDNSWQPYAMTNRELTRRALSPLLLNEAELSTTATSYACAWSKYNMLNITLGTYNNVSSQILVPTSEFTQTSTSRRVMIYYLPSTTSYYEIYRNGVENVYIKATNPDSSHRIKIYGVL